MTTIRSIHRAAWMVAGRFGSIAVVCVLALACGTARAQDIPQTPPPIRSKDLNRMLEAMQAGAEARAAAVAAFDAYVDRWQRLRDETVRPLQESMAAALAKAPGAAEPDMDFDVPDAPAGDAQTPAEAEAAAAAMSARIDEFRRAMEARDGARAAALEPFRARAAAVPNDVRAAERAFFELLRATATSDAQRAVVEREELVRRRRIAVASRPDLRTAFGLALTFPSLPSGVPADEALRARIDACIMAWERASTASLEQGGTADEFRSRRLAAAVEVAGMMPDEVGTRWIRGVRGRAANALGLWGIDPAAGLESALGDRATPEVRARIDRWADERDALVVQAAAQPAAPVDGVAASDRMALMTRDRELSEAALADLTALIADPALDKDALERKLMAESWKRRPDDDGDGGVRFAGESMMRSAMERSIATLGGDEAADAGDSQDADPFDPAMMERIMSAGTIRRADLEPVRARLGIPDEAATLWNQLCDDLVAKSADIESEMKSVVHAAMEGRGMVERSRAIAKRREAVETAWFDSVAAAFPSIPAEAIDAERGRRAVRRVIESGSLFLMQARMTGNRWIDADLDRAADACAPDARRAAAVPLADWRRAQVAAVGELVACSERMVERMSAASEAVEAANAAAEAEGNAEGAGVGSAVFEEFQKAQSDYQREVAEGARRAEAMQAASVQAVADAMPRPQAAVFRRSLRRQMHPEVYRDQDRVDAAIDSVLGDPSLGADQRGAVAAAWGESQTRFEGIAERLVAQSARNDRAMADMFGDMMGAVGSDGGPSDMERAATQSDDLAFDQAELRARTVRRVRAAVGDRVADAHGVR
ncbi:MAG: hypothetical protein FGM39_03355 [Phycisphaerales bacterium]|nr:hypothetical protein [Phycisphaerales bacterium]